MIDSNDLEEPNQIESDEEHTLSYRSSLCSPKEANNELALNRIESNMSSAKSSLNIENQMNPLTENMVVALPKKSRVNIDDENPKKLNHQEEVVEEEEEEVETSDLVNMEPKLREAWIKMRKLDLVLAKCCQRERNVKKETAALIEKNRADLERLRLESDRKETKQEAENTAHFLALSYVDLDEELEKKDFDDMNEPSTPLFKTQVPYDLDNISLMDEKIDTKETRNVYTNNNSSNEFEANLNKKNASSFTTSSNSKAKSKNTKTTAPLGKTQASNKSTGSTDKNGTKNSNNEKVNFII